MKNKSAFNEKTATADELWAFCMSEYSRSNWAVQTIFNRFFSVIQKMINDLPTNAKIFEIGCGAGESSRRIYPMCGERYFESSEFDPRYLEKLHQLTLPFKVSQESIYNLKRKDEAFDCLIVLEVLEHLDDVKKALDEIHRVSNRWAIVSMPNEPLWRILNVLRGKYLGDLGNSPGHINHWSRNSFEALLRSRFSKVSIKTSLPWLIAMVEK